MKSCVVTGGSRGIGAETVRTLTADGWSVAFFYSASEERARALARETGAYPVRCDVADRAQVFSAFADAEAWLGRVDALVSCAGIAQQKLFPDVTADEWRRMLDVNLSGAAYAAQAALLGMVSRRHGAIVFVTSIWGEVGASCEAHYSAAKAGLIGLAKALSKEVGPSGVRVNAVSPGVIQTDMLACFDDETLSSLAEETPLGRLGTPRDVASAIRFLLSSDASFITGQVLGVDGGFGR